MSDQSDDTRFTTTSGIRATRESTVPSTSRPGTTSVNWESRETRLSPAAITQRVTGVVSGRCVSTPGTRPRRNRTAATATYSNRAKADSRWPSTCPLRSDTTRITTWHAAKWERSAWPSILSKTWKLFSKTFLLDKVSTSMTINATAAILLALYVAVGRKQGVSRGKALRDGAKRSSQRVHGTRNLHLPARRFDANHHRHHRLLPAIDSQVQSHQHQRLSHSRSGLDGGPGNRFHSGQRYRVRQSGGRCGARRGRLRKAAFLLFQLPPALSRRDRQVPRRTALVGQRS